MGDLIGKTVKEAEIDGFGIRMVFTDGAVFEYSASDGGYSQYELTEATADAQVERKKKEIDRIESAIRHIQTSTVIDPWASEIAVRALRKQIPTPIIIENGFVKCAECGKYIRFPLIDKYNNCPECGQAIDWEDEE